VDASIEDNIPIYRHEGPAVAQAGDLWLQHFVGEEIEQAAHSTHLRGLGDGGEESIRLLGFIVGFAPGA